MKSLKFLSLYLLATTVLFTGVALSTDGFTSFIVGAGEYLAAKTIDSNATVGVLGINASGNTETNAMTGKSVVLSVAKTPIAVTGTNGTSYPVAGTGPIYAAAGVITPVTALTPAAGAYLSAVINIIATAAPTYAQVFAEPTKLVGKSISLYNKSASPVLIIPTDGGINATAALTPYSCATGKECSCNGYTNAQMVCVSK